MKYKSCLFFFLGLLFLTVAFGGAGFANLSAAEKSKGKSSAKVKDECRLAILQFENMTDVAEYNKYKKALCYMFTTDIQNAAKVSLVERNRIDDIIKELDCGESKYFDKKTAANIGQLFGATHILTGAYTCINGLWRIDVRLVAVKDSLVVFSEKQEGTGEESIVKMVADISANIGRKLENAGIAQEADVNDLSRLLESDFTVSEVKDESQPTDITIPLGKYPMKLTLVPAGTFETANGCNVTISKPFWIGRYRIIPEQLRKVEDENRRIAPASAGGTYKDEAWDLPVFTYNEAVHFCDRLNSKFRHLKGYRFAVPTAAQWELACHWVENQGIPVFGMQESVSEEVPPRPQPYHYAEWVLDSVDKTLRPDDNGEAIAEYLYPGEECIDPMHKGGKNIQMFSVGNYHEEQVGLLRIALVPMN